MQRLIPLICLGLTSVGLTSCGLVSSRGDQPNASASIKQLEQRINQLEQELQQIKPPGGDADSKTPAGPLRSLTLRIGTCLLYTSPSPRDRSLSRMPSSA